MNSILHDPCSGQHGKLGKHVSEQFDADLLEMFDTTHISTYKLVGDIQKIPDLASFLGLVDKRRQITEPVY